MTQSVEIKKVATTKIPTEWGEFDLTLYENSVDQKEHLSFSIGEVSGQENVIVRVHSECFTGDVLGSERCDCRYQLQTAIKYIAEQKNGVLIYMRQEGRGIGLKEKLLAYNLQDKGMDTVEANLALGHQADQRDYRITAAIINFLNIKSIKLITNNPIKIKKLEELDIKVTDRINLPSPVNSNNFKYLQTKIDRMDHLLDISPEV